MQTSTHTPALSQPLEPRRFFHRAGALAARVAVALLLLVLYGFAGAEIARAQGLRADLSAFVNNGHGRLIFTFSDEVRSEVNVSNGILIISFGQPVAVSLEQLERKLPGYLNATRRDPDGTAVRFSLARKVTVNVMEAGEKLFVDLLPEGWAGLPPGLPQDVIDDLARRARDAEQRARTKVVAQPRPVTGPLSIVRLRVSRAPTFSRLAFDMAEPIPVTLEREGQEYRVRFEAPVKIDISEAKTHLPQGVVGLDVALEEARSIVKLVVVPNAEVREFREDAAYIVDVSPPSLQGGAPPSVVELAANASVRAEAVRARAEAAAAEFSSAEEAARRLNPPLAHAASEDIAPAPLDFVSAPMAGGPVVPILGRNSLQFSATFGFADEVAAAMFMRGDTVWLVFDTPREIDVSALAEDPTHTVQNAEYLRSEFGAVVRLKLSRARLPSVIRDGTNWTLTLADSVTAPSRPVPLRRAAGENDRGAVSIPFAAPGQVHRISDPDVGDTIVVVTGQMPARGILRGQNFVEFRALSSIHGIALVPLADDVAVSLSADGVTVQRPVGLAVSDLPSAPPPPKEAAVRRNTPLEVEIWNAEEKSAFADREADLIRSVSASSPGQRHDARLMLARFYLAHEFAAEAKGVLDAGMREDDQLAKYPLFYLLHGMAELKLGRPESALADLTSQHLAGVQEAVLLRAAAQAGLGRWTEVRDSVRAGTNALPDLPLSYQRHIMLTAARAAVEVGDFSDASRIMNDLEGMDLPPSMQPAFAVIAGRIAEGIGRFDRARSLYDHVAALEEGPDAAEAKFRSVAMRVARGSLDRPKAIDRLETLAVSWRGGRLELETIRLLGRLHVAESRYRDAFKLLDAALIIDAESELTHEFHNELATVFEDLFLTGKSATLPPIEALALYYDFSRLTPIGRRGDELIRRLADRLVSVDLLDQASELLDHQVNYRLSGVARSQVAAKLAEIHLRNRKPAEAVRVLTATRMPQMPQELREQRMFIEARALSDSGRHTVALELIEHLRGAEVDRLRAEIAWAGKQWREAGERLEKLLGERWKEEALLDATERHDVLRAALAYTFGHETIGLDRLREKFGRKMGMTPESKVLSLLAADDGTSAGTLTEAARALANFDSLGSFLKLYRERYPERPLPPDPQPMGSLPQKRAAR
ncbi:MAG: hypothetical protein IT539_00820 [Bradyrhizobiaceae bacterium]|nr:hypothetical protein [Bradyrhizobiaceae bacterium]